MADQCRNNDIVCPKCSENHKLQDCKSETQICANCKHAKEVLKIPNIEYNHMAFNRECEAYKRIYQQMQMRVDYPNIYGSQSK